MSDPRWWVIVPLRLQRAKSRLARSTSPGLPAGPDLAEAFARDVIASVQSCASVAGVVIVSDRQPAWPRGDKPVVYASDPGQGLNAALVHAAAEVPAEQPVAALVGDLPAVTPTEIDQALRAGSIHPRSFVCDAEGTGTTMLMSLDPRGLDPAFGERSRAAHAASGAVEIMLANAPGLRRDVDTEVSLWDALRIGVGPATEELLNAGIVRAL